MSNPAPGELETVRGFVNTRDVDEDVEELATPAALAAWLREHELTGDDGDVSATVGSPGTELEFAL